MARSGKRASARGNGAASNERPVLPGQVVLVLQGGGALGAYQVGVYEALHEAGIEPDWVIGTSIGAINAALIAGNTREHRLARLRAFWASVEQRAGAELPELFPGLGNSLANMMTMVRGLPTFFAPNPAAWLGQHLPLGVEGAAYYTTVPLRETLSEMVDFDCINRHHVRLTVGAVNVNNGEMRYFDSRDEAICLEHVMASGALPPAFPAVRIDGGTFNMPVAPRAISRGRSRFTICAMSFASWRSTFRPQRAPPPWSRNWPPGVAGRRCTSRASTPPA